MYSVNIVDDEHNCRSFIQDKLLSYSKNYNVEFKINIYIDSKSFLKNKFFGDIIFLDIEMPGTNGIELAKKIREKDTNVCIIFITQMAQYALNGYEVDALGYIIKPINDKIFEATLTKCLNLLQKRLINNKSIVISVKGGKKIIKEADISYIEVMGNNLTYHTTDSVYECRGSLKQIISELDSNNFIKCNSCYLVNLKHVDGFIDGFILINNLKLKVSRNKKKEVLEKIMEQYI